MGTSLSGNRISELLHPPNGVSLGKLPLSRIVAEPLSLQERQTPTAFGALPVDVLFAHLDPHGIGIGQLAPSLADLSSLCEAHGIEKAKYLLRKLDGKGGYEIDL